jgi:Immunity protein 22
LAEAGPQHAAARALVSVWTGAFPSIEEAEAYFGEADEGGHYAEDCPFVRDFGLDHFDPWCLEMHFEQLAPRSLAPLLDGATFSPAFAAEALAAAAQEGVREAQGIALLYHIDYRANSVVRPQAGPLRFLGTFPFTGKLILGEHDTPFFQIAVRLRYPARGVFLVCETMQTLARKRKQPLPAREFCALLREHVDDTTLRECRLLTSEDVGRIVFAAVQAKVLTAREGESEGDFVGLYAL